MNKLAAELNEILAGTATFELLSDFGRRFYYPKGIPAQDAEAKKLAKRYNATVGMAFVNHEPVELRSVRAALPSLTPFEAVAYAPTGGEPALRTRWRQEIYRKNPDLAGIEISEPIVVPGLTSGISQVADLFLDPGDPIVIPDLFWENYSLIFEERRQAKIVAFPFFKEDAISDSCRGGALNIEGFRTAMASSARDGKVALIVNFPNNPTGYSPTTGEAEALASAIVGLAESGLRILVILDDAYFGLFYEPSIYRQSLLARLADAHENVLVMKVDGATKEDFVWGFRLAFVTFAAKGLSPDQREALGKKLLGAIRASISNSPKPAQSLLLKALGSPDYEEEKRAYLEKLRERYAMVRQIVEHRSAGRSLTALPFNSGYFMSFRTKRPGAEELRRYLLTEKGIGTVALEDRYLRVAYSSIELSELEGLYAEIFAAADRVLG